MQSAQGAPGAAVRRAQQVWRLVFVAAIVFCLFMALRPAGSAPTLFAHQDKLLHAAVFALLGWLGGRTGWGSGWQVFSYLMAFGAFIEFVQWFTPDRHAELGDLLADAAGALLSTRPWRRAGAAA